MTVPRTISSGFSLPFSLFVTTNGDIYVDNGIKNGRVDKWSAKTNSAQPVMSGVSSCYGLFVDINDTLYCSMYNNHKVVKKRLQDSATRWTTVAGTGNEGSCSDELDHPFGIFVDVTFDLYVADCVNNRIQLFPSGQLNGKTAAGDGSSSPSITLSCPTGIVVDADKYLFIVDQANHRIIGSGANGFRCLVACFRGGSASNELSYPRTLSFDSLGNMFVTDRYNDRVQKFLLSRNSCGMWYV
jgi:hypothetical protein